MSSTGQLQNKIRTMFFKALPAVALLGLIGSIVMFSSVEWTSAAFSIWATFLTGLTFTWVVWRSSSGFGGLAGAFLASRPAVYLGKISYGVYIIHAFVPSLLSLINVSPATLPQGVGAWFWVLIFTTISIASVSWYVLERPANRFKSHYKY
jgi:peptidoglycan/LPS O-acetylase OafA/YrhL